jgi:hypothetical protein
MKTLTIILITLILQACDTSETLSYGGALIHADAGVNVCVDVTTIVFYSSTYAVYTIGGVELVTTLPVAYYPGQSCDYATY